MTVSIFAGVETDYVWNGEVFVPDDVAGPKVRVRTLNYWQVQEVLAETNDQEKVRKCLAMGLVAVEGDEDQVKHFLAAPSPKLVNPLFNLIWYGSLGN